MLVEKSGAISKEVESWATRILLNVLIAILRKLNARREVKNLDLDRT
jgi:DNA-directed RNA polymerase specialized sigma24 family protein